MSRINRRDFLKLAAVAGGALTTALAPKIFQSAPGGNGGLPNIIILLFDAMSARNLSLYGYQRNTTPNLERFAQHATVYHAHHSGGNFTTPGTASLLTGTYPWTHRAQQLDSVIRRDLVKNNIFNIVGEKYFRTAFSQNKLPNFLFEQFKEDLDFTLPPDSFSVVNRSLATLFTGDRDANNRADSFLSPVGKTQPTASLMFGSYIELSMQRDLARLDRDLYPAGLPQIANYQTLFRLNEVLDGVGDMIVNADVPHLSYFHIMAPHAPYHPIREYYDLFEKDGYKPIPKKEMPLNTDRIRQSGLDDSRKIYDGYIANVDADFGILMDKLEQSGTFKNSYVIVTADHGEMFERGVRGHLTPLLYEPVMNIPLLISAPDQVSRKDIFTPTNCVDILPTVAKITGSAIPDWCEGQVLPGFGGSEEERSTFTVEAKDNSSFAALSKATIAIRKGNYKMIYYTGYQSEDIFELFDIEADPEELKDLYPAQPAVARLIKEELLENFNSANAKYIRP